MPCYHNKIKTFILKNKIQPLFDVLYFAILLLGFHFLWKYWENSWNFRLFSEESIFIPIFHFLTRLVFNSADFFISFLLKGHFHLIGLSWHFDNGGYIEIVDGCSGLKAFFQFIVIILFSSGPWRHKIWYIPMGLVILFISNIIRIIGLLLVVYYYQTAYAFAHNYFFRPFFYGVIFLLWVIWVEYFKNGKTKNIRRKRKNL